MNLLLAHEKEFNMNDTAEVPVKASIGENSFDLSEFKQVHKSLQDAFNGVLEAYNAWIYKAQAISDLSDVEVRGDKTIRFFPAMIAVLGEDLRNDIWHSKEFSALIAAMDAMGNFYQRAAGVPAHS